MRRHLISLLLASAVLSASAQAQDDHERGSRGRAERSSSDDDSKANRPERAERTERAPRAERADAQKADADRGRKGASDRPARGDDVRIEREERVQRAGRSDRPGRPVPVRQQVTDNEPVVEPQAPTVEQPVRQSHGGSDSLVDGFRRVARGETDGRDHDGHDRDKDHDWSKDWRKDHRYDWWNYRNRYRSLYRLGRYHDPYGWGYRRWSIGYGLWPSHYSSNFWLNDPWMYRLPQSYGPYRWVRYYDDALLVNIYTGQVVDVVYNFFW